MKTVVVSGGFDPLHVGHTTLFEFARSMGDRLEVIVECDSWVSKKHRVILPEGQRCCIVSQLVGVDAVHLNPDPSGDDSVLLEKIRPEVFCVGPDHADRKIVEAKTCERLGIRLFVRPSVPMVDDIHSTDLLRGARWKNPLPIVGSLISRMLDPDEWFADQKFDRELLLARRGNTEKWEIVGGFVEVGETLEQAIVREVREETVATLLRPTYFGSFVGQYYDGRDIVVPVFEGTLDRDPVPTQECSQFKWVREFPDDLPFHHELDRRVVQLWFKEQK